MIPNTLSTVSAFLSVLFGISFFTHSHGALKELDDSSLSEVSAQSSIGLILDDVQIHGDSNANLQLSFDTNLGGDDSAFFDHVSIYGSDSGAACDENPSITACSGVDIGSFSNPIELNLGTEENITFLELKWVDSQAGVDSGMDIQTRFTTVTPGTSGVGESSSSTSYKIDTSWLFLQDLTLADSSIRLFSSDALDTFEVGNDGLISNNRINGENPIGLGFTGLINTSFSFFIDAGTDLGFGGTGPTPETQKLAPFSSDDRPRHRGTSNSANASEGFLIFDAQLENLAIGYYPYLPLRFGSIDRNNGGTANRPDFFLEVPIVPNDPGIYNAFYANQPKANIQLNNITLGHDVSGNPYNVGSATLRDIRIQHLRIETNGS